jgi:ribosomal protein S10
MPFVTTLTFRSGNRYLLDEVVDEIKTDAERKGVELKGPHAMSTETLRVPQTKRLLPEGGAFEAWTYTVYTRTIEIIGYDEFARAVAERDLPDAVSVGAEIEQRSA